MSIPSRTLTLTDDSEVFDAHAIHIDTDVTQPKRTPAVAPLDKFQTHVEQNSFAPLGFNALAKMASSHEDGTAGRLPSRCDMCFRLNVRLLIASNRSRNRNATGARAKNAPPERFRASIGGGGIHWHRLSSNQKHRDSRPQLRYQQLCQRPQQYMNGPHRIHPPKTLSKYTLHFLQYLVDPQHCSTSSVFIVVDWYVLGFLGRSCRFHETNKASIDYVVVDSLVRIAKELDACARHLVDHCRPVDPKK